MTMRWKLALVVVPVSDIDRSKDFYVGRVGSNCSSTTGPGTTSASCS